MNKVELSGLLEREIEKEIEILKDGESYAYQLVESAMRLNILVIAIDKLDDIEEDLEFSEDDVEEFLNDVVYVADSTYEGFAEQLDLMDWENKIGKAVFGGY
jgi:hypothetical protein